MGDLREPRGVGRPLVAVENRLVNAKEHFNISKLPKGKRRGCAVCSDRETKRAGTSYLCLTCDVGLCPVACWKDYHTKKVLCKMSSMKIELHNLYGPDMNCD